MINYMNLLIMIRKSGISACQQPFKIVNNKLSTTVYSTDNTFNNFLNIGVEVDGEGQEYLEVGGGERGAVEAQEHLQLALVAVQLQQRAGLAQPADQRPHSDTSLYL